MNLPPADGCETADLVFGYFPE